MSLARLSGLLRKLEKQLDLHNSYDAFIQDQIEQDITEPLHLENDASPMFYLPHKPVIREAAGITKLRIVYDALSRQSENYPSLDNCLETGPPL